MNEFLEKREVVSLCLCVHGVFPAKEKYVTIEEEERGGGVLSMMTNEKRFVHTLPDGSIHFLKIVQEVQRATFIITQEYKHGVPHGKHKHIVIPKSADSYTKYEGTIKNGRPHGMFFSYMSNGRLESACTFVRGKVMEFLDNKRQWGIFSRNKHGATFLVKDGRKPGELKVSSCSFFELTEEKWNSVVHIEVCAETYKDCECRTQKYLLESHQTEEAFFDRGSTSRGVIVATNFLFAVKDPDEPMEENQRHSLFFD
ncbi:hypothetical protein D1R32_gp011 [Tunisvirus fontaine2]|uniref:MORN repeat-containing protein n=1 Tax=Tunisvirus fontaine2 TaxID=1421067 RepID=V9SCZ6_9VIRU|nr:hypothetical protein D1R32_gp011 [Tunisvirus fontaine2]AHC54728.1 hypothetical protein TNS_ORF10 [Tunisvirus fontaine2]